MKFFEIFRFEFTYQIRRTWFWLTIAALIILTFLTVRDGSLSVALYEDFFINSPFSIAFSTVAGSLIWLMIAAAVVGEAAARDVATGMYPLNYTVPSSKIDYLGGRFLASFALNALILLFVQVGIMLAVYLPGVHPDVIQPFRFVAYLTAYGYISLPLAFIATAIQFFLATPSGRPMASYLGSIFLFFMTFFVASALLYHESWGSLMDPVGFRFIVEDLSRLWTTTEKNWSLISLEGIVLKNRLLWVFIALVAIVATYLRFRFEHRTERTSWKFWTRRKGLSSPIPADVEFTSRPELSIPKVSRAFGLALYWRQTLEIAWTSFRTIATSFAGLAMLIGIPLLMIPVLVDQLVSDGIQLLPSTILVLNEMTDPITTQLGRWVIIPLLLVIFAGELIWREREANLADITDTVPGSEWSSLLGKFLGLGLMLVVFLTILMASGIFTQMMMGYQDLKIWLYLIGLFVLQLPEYLLFAILALMVHVLVDNKYIGHMVGIVVYIIISMSTIFGIEHNLLIYGASPDWTYTDIRGFGSSLFPWLWFKLYWGAWALLLAVVAKLLWVRGRENSLKVRLQLIRRRFTRATAITSSIAFIGIVILGSFIFYNTNILNENYSSAEKAELKAEYERKYRQYAGILQPILSDTKLQVEIYPKDKKAEISGAYQLVNRSEVAIDSIHIATVPGVKTKIVGFDRPATPELSDKDLGYHIYVLERPLQSGDSLILNFEVYYSPTGFQNDGVQTSVVPNGSYFTNQGLPLIGYQQSRELIQAADRREYGLSPEPIVPSLYNDEEWKGRNGGGTTFEAVISTTMDQVAVAPGTLKQSWAEDDRRYFKYSTGKPIGNEWAFFSADYELREENWNNPDPLGQDIAIKVYYHPEHTAQLDRIIRSVKASLDYYTREFGSYDYKYISIIEAPGNGVGMHAEASMLTYTEGFNRLNPKSGSLDFPFAIVAHEMAHQWTVPYAFVEGAPIVSESVAWYYAMKVVEESKGFDHLQQLLSFMRQPNPIPPIRRGEPLLQGLDPYLSYRKGPFALYAISEYIGEEQLNKALHTFHKNHDYQGAPLASTLDLYREIRKVTPDSLQYLLHDLFEVNTFWEFETEQASAEKIGESLWQVTLDVQARKVVADSAGIETEVSMDEWVEIGVFGSAGESGNELSEPCYVQKHRIHSGEQTITIQVSCKPASAGIDPYHLLDWEVGSNIEPVNNEQKKVNQ